MSTPGVGVDGQPVADIPAVRRMYVGDGEA